MATINELMQELLQSQVNDINLTNESERDGNTSDILFRIAQPTVGLSVAGGATTTSLSPSTLVNELASGILSWRVLVLLVLIGLGAWWLFKK